jgi:hypothetical protein
MTSVRPEDKPKLYAMIGACVLVFAMMFMQIRNAINPPRSAAKKEKVVRLTPEKPKDIAQRELNQMAPIQVVSSIAPPSTTDPFREVLPSTDTRTVRPSEDRPARMEGDIPELPGASRGGGASFAPVLEARAFTPSKDERVGSNDLWLKGILTGGSPVAVFTKGDRDIIIRPGESFGGGISLLSVTNLGAVVRFNNKVLELELGQAITVSQPELMPAPGPVGPGQMPPLLLSGIG